MDICLSKNRWIRREALRLADIQRFIFKCLTTFLHNLCAFESIRDLFDVKLIDIKVKNNLMNIQFENKIYMIICRGIFATVGVDFETNRMHA